MVIDSNQLKSNAKTLEEEFPNAKRILKKADGKKTYKEIAKDTGIHEKTISRALKSAWDYGFAERIKPGIYKRKVPTIKYLSKRDQKNTKTADSIVKKFSKKRKKIASPKKSVRFDYEGKVDSMATAYGWLFITENMLRDLIRDVLGKENNWWENRVPKGIRDSIDDTIRKSKYDDAPKKDNLEYTHLGQLKEIIISNWSDFEPLLKSNKSVFQHELDRVIPQRNAIGHCIPLKGDDYKYAKMRFEAVLKMLN